MGWAVTFPGQGSQRTAMGVPWHERPEWRVVHEAEEALDQPVGPLLLDDRPLSTTGDVQLAVFVMGLMAWESTRGDVAQPPVAFAGHSLGQLTALVAAEVVDRPQGFRLVRARADATQRAAELRPGRMVALLGADPAQAAAACAVAPDGCWIANLNAPGQVVIGGTPEGTDAAVREAARIGIRRARPLDVAAAFHTPLMAGAVDEVRPVVETLALRPGTAPVVANDDARAVIDVEEWRHRLLDHLVRPVRWEECVHRLRDLGAVRLIEPGGSTLSGLHRRIDPALESVSITAPATADVARSAGRS